MRSVKGAGFLAVAVLTMGMTLFMGSSWALAHNDGKGTPREGNWGLTQQMNWDNHSGKGKVFNLGSVNGNGNGEANHTVSVPEPSSLLILGSAMAWFGILYWRKRAKG